MRNFFDRVTEDGAVINMLSGSHALDVIIAGRHGLCFSTDEGLKRLLSNPEILQQSLSDLPADVRYKVIEGLKTAPAMRAGLLPDLSFAILPEDDGVILGSQMNRSLSNKFINAIASRPWTTTGDHMITENLWSTKAKRFEDREAIWDAAAEVFGITWVNPEIVTAGTSTHWAHTDNDPGVILHRRETVFSLVLWDSVSSGYKRLLRTGRWLYDNIADFRLPTWYNVAVTPNNLQWACGRSKAWANFIGYGMFPVGYREWIYGFGGYSDFLQYAPYATARSTLFNAMGMAAKIRYFRSFWGYADDNDQLSNGWPSWATTPFVCHLSPKLRLLTRFPGYSTINIVASGPIINTMIKNTAFAASLNLPDLGTMEMRFDGRVLIPSFRSDEPAGAEIIASIEKEPFIDVTYYTTPYVVPEDFVSRLKCQTDAADAGTPDQVNNANVGGVMVRNADGTATWTPYTMASLEEKWGGESIDLLFDQTRYKFLGNQYASTSLELALERGAMFTVSLSQNEANDWIPLVAWDSNRLTASPDRDTMIQIFSSGLFSLNQVFDKAGVALTNDEVAAIYGAASFSDFTDVDKYARLTAVRENFTPHTYITLRPDLVTDEEASRILIQCLGYRSELVYSSLLLPLCFSPYVDKPYIESTPLAITMTDAEYASTAPAPYVPPQAAPMEVDENDLFTTYFVKAPTDRNFIGRPTVTYEEVSSLPASVGLWCDRLTRKWLDCRDARRLFIANVMEAKQSQTYNETDLQVACAEYSVLVNGTLSANDLIQMYRSENWVRANDYYLKASVGGVSNPYTERYVLPTTWRVYRLPDSTELALVNLLTGIHYTLNSAIYSIEVRRAVYKLSNLATIASGARVDFYESISGETATEYGLGTLADIIMVDHDEALKDFVPQRLFYTTRAVKGTPATTFIVHNRCVNLPAKCGSKITVVDPDAESKIYTLGGLFIDVGSDVTLNSDWTYADVSIYMPPAPCYFLYTMSSAKHRFTTIEIWGSRIERLDCPSPNANGYMMSPGTRYALPGTSVAASGIYPYLSFAAQSRQTPDVVHVFMFDPMTNDLEKAPSYVNATVELFNISGEAVTLSQGAYTITTPYCYVAGTEITASRSVKWYVKNEFSHEGTTYTPKVGSWAFVVA